MSSTNRSNSRDSHISDYYITPIPAIEKFLIAFKKTERLCHSMQILDPCAGGDNEHPMFNPETLREFGCNNISTIDIREDSLADIKTDYLSYSCENQFDMIITNPPFNIAVDIINKALSDVKDDGFVVMLLRLNFLGGKVREQLWKDYMPKYIFVHNRRMSFTDDGKTNSIEYAHFVWQKGYKPEFSKLKVI